MHKIVIVDGQGGRIGAMLVEALRAEAADIEVCAIGTNSIATASMLKSGATYGATGENPLAVNCLDADIVIGPIGIVVANSLHGEVTPSMACAIGASRAEKILLPINRCNISVVGVRERPIPELIQEAVEQVRTLVTGGTEH